MKILKKVEAVKAGKVTATSLLEEALKSIETSNKSINAVVALDSQAHQRAAEIDKQVKTGRMEDHRILGIPITLKDMVSHRGRFMSACSKILEGYEAPFSATLVERLENAGAIVIGRCNQDEFGMGSSCEYSKFGPTKNPVDISRVAGGSSGGSAAAVRAGMGDISIGTDTGGSIRLPAHYCGVVGLKPTYGRVSRFGVISYASSMDQAGPIGNYVEDVALALEVISGQDDKDSTSSDMKVPQFSKKITGEISAKKVGILIPGEVDPEVSSALNDARHILQNWGAVVSEIQLKTLEYAVPSYYLIACAEASSNLSRYEGVRFGQQVQGAQDFEEMIRKTRTEFLGEEVKKRIILGTHFLSAGYVDEFYKKACKVRRVIFEEIQSQFQSYDFIVSPVATTPAFSLNSEKLKSSKMYLTDQLTVLANLAGIPAMSVPIRQTPLPIGVQIMAPHFQEESLLNIGLALEKGVEA